MSGPESRKLASTNIRVGFYLPEEINDAMLAAAEKHECSRNDVLVWLVEKGLQQFMGKKPKNPREYQKRG